MTEKDLDIAIEKCERIMEFDTRTMQNPVSENGWIFEKVYDLLQFLRQLQFSTNAISVIRCRDCKHYQFSDNRAFGLPVKRCEWTGFEDVDDEDFCSRGERKDGEHHDNNH